MANKYITKAEIEQKEQEARETLEKTIREKLHTCRLVDISVKDKIVKFTFSDGSKLSIEPHPHPGKRILQCMLMDRIIGSDKL